MEQKKIHGSSSTHDDSNDRSLSIEDIPLELMAEILSRLPGKLIGSKRDKLFVFSSPQAESYQFKIPRDGFLQRYDSVHGLVYLETSTQLMIWNPTMKRFFTLPEPEGSEGKYITGSLGYDPIDCKYKALCHLTGDKIGILTLGSQELWRILSQGFPSHSRRMSEKFHLIKYPSRDGCFFVSYEGRLALMVSSNGHSGIELWILVNAENHQWVYKHFPTPHLPYTFWALRDMKLKGVTDAGIAIDDLKRLRVPGSDFMEGLSVVPNHIESLMSL
ncbi:hypothetical protein YC2023_037403 [Brassica napus]